MRTQHPLAVCSWSLRPRSARELASLVLECGLSRVQLALDPIRLGLDGWGERETVEALDRAGVSIVSGMMAPAREDYSTLETIRASGGLRPDDTWEENRRAAHDNAALASRLGVPLVTLHAGCVPDDATDPLRATALARLREACSAFASRGVRVAFETGQDAPGAMLDLLRDLSDLEVGVNFDPANMILYGSAEPMAALTDLAPHVRQVHLKDAIASGTPGRWGTEVPAGSGQVPWDRFFAFMRERLPGVTIVIEREAGENRVEDVRAGAALARRVLEGAR